MRWYVKVAGKEVKVKKSIKLKNTLLWHYKGNH